MKLRILDDSVRLRLDRDEVDAVGRGETVSASTRFAADSVFEYRLTAGEHLDAVFDGAVMTISVSAPEAARWAADDTAVSIRGEAGPVAVLVEKDFECLEPREGESQANRFPNPKAG